MKKLLIWTFIGFLQSGINTAIAAEKTETIECFPSKGLQASDLVERNSSSSLKSPIRVAIIGMIKNPGWYYIEVGASPLGVIEMAGGRTPTASPYSLVISNEKRDEVWFLKNHQGNQPKILERWILKEGDFIFIAEIIK